MIPQGGNYEVRTAHLPRSLAATKRSAPTSTDPSTLNTWRCATTRAASAAPICNRPRRRPRFAIAPARLLITDGPFADTKEVLGGYYVLDAADLDEALEFVQRIPAVRLGGAVEVRPLVEIPMEDAF